MERVFCREAIGCVESCGTGKECDAFGQDVQLTVTVTGGALPWSCLPRLIPAEYDTTERSACKQSERIEHTMPLQLKRVARCPKMGTVASHVHSVLELGIKAETFGIHFSFRLLLCHTHILPNYKYVKTHTSPGSTAAAPAPHLASNRNQKEKRIGQNK
jgi:hypothetical protein